MSTSDIRLLGFLTFLFEAGMLFILISPRRRQLGPIPPDGLIRITIFFVSATVVGIGLVYLRKWAAVILALALGAIATWLIQGTIRGVPFPANLINFAIGGLLIVMVVLIIRSWSKLSWGGKWLL